MKILDGDCVSVPTERLLALELTAMRYDALRQRYAGCDFADPQYPEHVVVKFALPFLELRVSSDLDATVDHAITLQADRMSP